MRTRHLAPFTLGILGLLAGLAAPAAHAGCGCQKPPPPPAAVRPNVTYAGTPVTFFSSAFQAGQQYTVTFASGTSAATASVTAQAVSRRDLADATTKTQLVVMLPSSLPLGPTRIAVKNTSTGSQIMAMNDSAFTVAPQPIAVPTDYGRYHWPNYRAAVGRDGVVYVSLDLSGLTQPIVFEAQATGYPLRFSSNDVVFRNVQGFLMQLLVQNGVTPVPGMFVYPADSGSSDSDRLHYSRHEFSTYFLQHQERQPHQVDPSDGNWHMDGSRHVDHNHLILVIMGHMPDGSLPKPGATPAFDLSAANFSLFYQGLSASTGIYMTDYASIDGYSDASGSFNAEGDVFSNGTVSVQKSAVVSGDATAQSFSVASSATITGTQTQLAQATTFMDVKVPAGLPNLGDINMCGNGSMTINGPGSFEVSSIAINNATLYVDNSAGPVTLYVDGGVDIQAGGTIAVADPNPEKFAIYVASASGVNLTGGSSAFHGVVYAPYSKIYVTSQGDFYGAFVADKTQFDKHAQIHYWSALRGQ